MTFLKMCAVSTLFCVVASFAHAEQLTGTLTFEGCRDWENRRGSTVSFSLDTNSSELFRTSFKFYFIDQNNRIIADRSIYFETVGGRAVTEDLSVRNTLCNNWMQISILEKDMRRQGSVMGYLGEDLSIASRDSFCGVGLCLILE